MGSLVAAIACVFVLAGGVVAFHGWPELDSAGAGPTLVVTDVPRAPLQVASVHRSKPAPSTRRSSAPAPATAARRVIASAPERVVRRESAVATRPVETPKPAATEDTSPASPLEPVADTAEQTTSGLGQTVTDTTGALGGAVGGALGETVTNLGAGLGQTVSDTGTLLANVLRAIKPAR